MKTIKTVNGTRLHYDRFTEPGYGYGTRGKSYGFKVSSKFNTQIRACLKELFDLCPLGKPEIITSGGTKNDKLGSLHYTGDGIDIDGLFWKSFSMITIDYHQHYEMYLACESIFRKHFGVVLSYNYNLGHRDHFHIDNSGTLYFEPVRSKTLYCQMVLHRIYQLHVEVDGIWGAQTRGALEQVFDRLKISGDVFDQESWFEFLTKTAKVCFKLFSKDTNPRKLLDRVYSELEQSDIQSLYISQMLNHLDAFRTHDETQNWLAEFNEESNLEAILKSVAKT